MAEQEQPGTAPFIGSLGGRIDEGETPLQAAQRELMEESGYQATELTLWFAIQPIEKIDWVVYVFLAKGVEKVAEPNLDAGEKVKLLFVTFEEFLKITAQKNYRDKEVALHIHHLLHNPEEMEKTKKLFLE